MHYEIFKDEAGKWRWRAIANNNRKIASSGESFASKRNARRAVHTFQQRTYAAECVWTKVSRPGQPPSYSSTLKIKVIE